MALILIVDDSATQALNLSRIMKRHGHEVLTARDGAEGVSCARAELPDLIIMDVVMPRLNGFQATRQLSRDAGTCHIPIILVTTKDQESDALWGKRQGAKAYLVKPVDEDLLIDTIKKLLDSGA